MFLVRSALLFAALAGCADLPRDPDGTLDRVRREHRFAVGEVLGPGPVAGPIIARIERATGARAVITRGQLEPLLLALEAGRLDLVVGGRFDAKTPWQTRITLGPPLATVAVGDTEQREHAVARNGENAWIILVQREAKAVATDAGHE